MLKFFAVWGVAMFCAAAVVAGVPGDADQDDDVDFDDFQLSALCQFGPDSPTVGLCAEYFDIDFDTDLDMADFASFQRCFSGMGAPAFDGCVGHQVRIENNCLHIIGTAADSTLALRLSGLNPQILEIDVGDDGFPEFAYERSMFSCIIVDARGGNDVVRIDESHGVFTDVELTTISGGIGDDTLIGGSGSEIFVGGPGHDTIALGAGDDRFRWKPGDDSDVIDDGGGTDTVEIEGSSAGEVFAMTANGTRVRFDRVSPGPFFLDIGGCEKLTLSANGGDDRLTCTGNLAALIQITADGGAGNDTLLGSNGVDILRGGDGNDFIDGNQGNDVILCGAGDDTVQWDPGDGSDVIEGEGDHDVIIFNGSAANEIFQFFANGPRLRLTRDIGSIVLDADGIEQFDLRALGGTDTITVNDLAGTDIAAINISLAAAIGGTTGDSSVDSVVVNATGGADNVAVGSSGTTATVTGLAAIVNVSVCDATLDRITVNGLGGNDVLQSVGLAAGIVGVTLSGGVGNDTLTGGPAAETLSGDDDNDTIRGGGGDDTLSGGAGNDRIIWNAGDGSDIVSGDGDSDTIEINGSSAAEVFSITANGSRVRLDRISPAPSFLDIGACENLVLNAGGGNDMLTCIGNLAALIQITADGGPGDDTLLGGNGADVLIGGDDNDFIDGNQGNDVLMGGAGNDTMQWDPGDGNDTIEGQGGRDTLVFNGSNIGEVFDLSPNGSRVRFTRNIASIVLDLNGIEQFDLRAVGGVDALTVNDLAGTRLTAVNIDLAGTIGGSVGDAAVDAITLNGSAAADVILVGANAGVVEVSGLAALVRVLHPEISDTLTVNGLGGTDSIVTGAGVAALMMIVTNP